MTTGIAKRMSYFSRNNTEIRLYSFSPNPTTVEKYRKRERERSAAGGIPPDPGGGWFSSSQWYQISVTRSEVVG